jgi:hypothetical protein
MPSSNFTQVRMRKSTRELLKRMAEIEGRSMSGMLDLLVTERQWQRSKAFVTMADLPLPKDAKGNKLQLDAGKARKSKLGARFNGRHKD